MFQELIRKIAEKFAERLGAVERVAGEQSFNLFELQGFLSHGDHRRGIVTSK